MDDRAYISDAQPAIPLDVVVAKRDKGQEVLVKRNDLNQQAMQTTGLPKRGRYHYASITTALPHGLSAKTIRIEVSLHQGLPYFELVGIPSGQAQAVRSRVTAAIKNSGFQFPDQRIIAAITSEMTVTQAHGLDLPLALALLQASGQVNIPDQLAFTGQLSLVGEFIYLPTVYNLFNTLANSGVKRIISGRCNGTEAAEVAADFVLTSNLRETCALLNAARTWQDLEVSDLSPYKPTAITLRSHEKMAELPTQFLARYALMIAAAGKHHILMLGAAGCGKTSLARLLPFLLPELSEEEKREVLAIYSASGLPLEQRLSEHQAPFRQPHFEISQAALIGGGNFLQPGEISLSHHGVLFLDELSEFRPVQLNALRTVLTDGQIDLARNRRRQTLPADIILIAASNPCPCGNYLEAESLCRCRAHQVRRKLDKLKGPFIDRIDLFVELKRIPKDELLRTIEEGQLCDIPAMKARVANAIAMQKVRYQGLEIKSTRNSNLPSNQITALFQIEADALRMAEKLAQSHLLSVRGFHKLLRVGRTIADLDQSPTVRTGHISLAAQFRAKSYFWDEEEV